MATRIQIAKSDIVKVFQAGPQVLTPLQFNAIFSTGRDDWRLARRMTLQSFRAFMVKQTPLKSVRFDFPQRAVVGYTWGDVPLLERLVALAEHSYLSHYTAVRLHGLTEQLPNTIYLSREKSATSTMYSTTELEDIEQQDIDTAFGRPPRASKNEVTVDGLRVLLLQGAPQEERGVISSATTYDSDQVQQLRCTNLERTLIDIAVRPFYAGGVFEVAKAFENAKDKFSVNALVSMLKRMKLVYPYHQAIGFYLERAGYKASQLSLVRSIPMDRDFYLTHEMGKTRFVSDWRLHVPEGF